MSKKIPVIEIFGKTIQGEGMMIGKPTMFVRTYGCDYRCSFCDSAFTWDGSAKHLVKHMTSSEIIKELVEKDNFSHVTISGGNPALLDLTELISELHDMDVTVGLETQGSKWQDWFYLVDDLTFSPKPPSSHMKTDYLLLSEIINNLKQRIKEGHVTLKIVVFNDEDFEYAKHIHKLFPHVPMFLQVGNDDVTTLDDNKLTHHLLRKLEWLIDKVITDKEMNSVRVLPQLHTLIWGNKRGV